MSTIAKHHKLYKEDADKYEIIDTRDKKTFPIAKRHLSLAMHKELSKIQRFDEGGEAQADSGTETPPVTVNVNSAPQAEPTLGVNTAIPAPSMPVVNTQPQGATAPPVAIKTPAPIATNLPLVQQAAINQKNLEKGIVGENQAAAQENAENVKNIQAHNEGLQKVFEGYQASRAKIDSENAALTDAVLKSDIDPNKYYHDLSLPGKISTGIAVILGGIGMGLQHSNVNQALQVVDNAIQRDIEAQKANLGKKQSLLSMNMEKYKNLDAATAATTQQMNAMFEGNLKLAAAKSGNPRAQAAADQAIALNRQKNILESPQLAVQQYKVDALNSLSGTPSAPSAAQRILSPTTPRQPNAGATPGETPNAPSDKSAENPSEPTGLDWGVTPDMIDNKKLQGLKLAELLKGEDANKVQQEISEIFQNHSAKQQIKKEFDRMEQALAMDKLKNNPNKRTVLDNMLTVPTLGLSDITGIGKTRVKEVLEQTPGLGGMLSEASPWGNREGRLFDASRKGALDTINRILSKRIGGEAAKNIKAGLPTGQEDYDERQEQLQRIYDMIDKSVDTSALQQNGLLKKK